ncbi:MAG: glycosyltransferase family 4 protein [Aeromicrobium sp.]
MTGLTAYQDACFRELTALGDDLLLIHPKSMAYAPFDKSAFTEHAKRIVWDEQMPSYDTLLPSLEEFRPDVIIMWSWDGKGYRKVMKTWRGRALRVMFSSNFWHGSAKQYAGLVLHGLYVNPLFDCVWVPGERSELFARRIGFGGKDIIRGANSADTPTFDRGPRERIELSSRRRFLFAGRLIWHKAPTMLAHAYAAYRDRVDQPWDLHVVGDGPLRGDFKSVEGVHRHGFLQPAELAGLMHESSCLILPSYIEWYGVVVHEAAIAGLPLICSDGVGAVPHLLQDGFNGWTIAAGDQEGLTDAMYRMTSIGSERLQAMSDGSRALGSRITPRIWALNLHEELERRSRSLRRMDKRA